MITWTRLNDEVLYTAEHPSLVSAADIARFKEMAARNRRPRLRLCTHAGPGEALHEMLIVVGRDSYIRPHRHLDKAESLHVIEGEAQAVFFADDGAVERVAGLGAYGSGRPFYYRIDRPVFHTLVVHTDWLVFAEATLGPFDPARTAFAPWAPEEADADGIRRFQDELKQKIVR